jgi:surfeit locus 1 family protein
VRQVGQIVQALFSRKWWWVTFLVLVLMGVLARLGFWQLDRLDQRRAKNAIVAAALTASPVDLFEEDLTDDLAALRDRQVALSGEYDLDNQLVLKIQNWEGRAGAHLITPLLRADGEMAVLVDRGWIPEAENNAVDRSKYDVSGPVKVEGYVAMSQALRGRESSVPVEPVTEWYRIDIASIQPQMPYELLPIYVVQAPEDIQQDLPYRTAQEIDLSEGSHLGYAVQWFIFSLGLGTAYVVYVRKGMKESESA